MPALEIDKIPPVRDMTEWRGRQYYAKSAVSVIDILRRREEEEAALLEAVEESQERLDRLRMHIRSQEESINLARAELKALIHTANTEIQAEWKAALSTFKVLRDGNLVTRIKRTVAAYYKMPYIDIFSDRRTVTVAIPRQVAMYLARTMTTLSLPAIGIHFGRDHTTALHAIRKITKRLGADENLVRDVEAIRVMLCPMPIDFDCEEPKPAALDAMLCNEAAK